MKRVRPWTKLEERRAVELRQVRYTIAAVARALDRPYGAVSVKLSRLGATKRRSTRRRPGEFLAAVAATCKPGVSDRDAARVLNRPHQEIFRARKRLGISAGVTLSEAARRPRPTRVKCRHRCWLCNAPRPFRGGVLGWQQRRFGKPAQVETYCPECFAKWGWPTIPIRVVAPRQPRTARKRLATPQVHERIINLHNAGFTPREIALEVGYRSDSSVRRYLKALELPVNVKSYTRVWPLRGRTL